MSVLNRKDKAIIILILLIAVSFPFIVQSQTPPGPNTLEQGEGLNFPTITATDGYFYGATNLTDRLLGNWDVALTSPTFDTGQGANELYDMNQNVLNTSDVEFNSVDMSEIYLNSVEKTFILEDTQAQGQIVAYVGDDVEKANFSNYFYVDGTNDHIQVEEALNYTIENHGMGNIYLDVDELTFGGQVDFNGSGEQGWQANIERGISIIGRGRINGTTIYPPTNSPCFYLTNKPHINLIGIKFNGTKVAMTEPFIHGDSQDLAVLTTTNRNDGFSGVIKDCHFRGGPPNHYLIELENPYDWAFEGYNQFYVKEGGAGAILINGTSLSAGNRGDGVSSGYVHIWLDSNNSIALHALTHPSANASFIINFLWWDNLKLGLRGNDAKDNLTGIKLEGIENCRFNIISEHIESVAQMYDCERIDITGEITSFPSNATANTPAFDDWNPYPVMFYVDEDCVDIDIGIKDIYVRNGYTTIFVDQSSIQKRNTIFHDTVIRRQSSSSYIDWNITTWTSRFHLSGNYGRSEHSLHGVWDISDGTELYISHYLMETPQSVFIQGKNNETRAIFWKSGSTNSTHICLGIPWVVTGDDRPFLLKASIDKN